MDKIPEPDGFTAEPYLTSKEQIIPMLFKIFQSFEKDESPSNLFYKDSITLIPIPE